MRNALIDRSPKMVLGALLALGATVFTFVGFHWGLPGPVRDRFLFRGDRQAVMDQVLRLTKEKPYYTNLHVKDFEKSPEDKIYEQGPVTLSVRENASELWRLYRHYLLWSDTGDVSTTFGPLSRIKPAKLQFNPGAFQYGGAFLYPIGALLWISDAAGFLDLSHDLDHFVRDPAEFRKAVLVGRGFVVAMSVLCVMMVFFAAAEWKGLAVGVLSGVLFLLMPGPMIMAREMKPHGAAAVWAVLAFIGALRYFRNGSWRSLIVSSIASGLGMGTALYYGMSALFPAMAVLLRTERNLIRFRRLVEIGLLSAAFFVLTNPYFLFNLDIVKGEASIRWVYKDSNAPGVLAGLQNLFVHGTPIWISGFSVFALGLLLKNGTFRRETVLITAPLVLYLAALWWASRGIVPFRMAVFVYPFLAMLCAGGVDLLWRKSRILALTAGLVLVGLSGIRAADVLSHYVADVSGRDAFAQASEWIRRLPAGTRLGVSSPPGPGFCPPFPFQDYEIVVFPRDFDWSQPPGDRLPEYFLSFSERTPAESSYRVEAAFRSRPFTGDFSASMVYKNFFILKRRDLP
ncbi:MAG: hypothetical protein HY548_05620 [Elusimicrobia bacterium]|nr:hypothetical protein [Elusimicrobiota bacterium]